MPITIACSTCKTQLKVQDKACGHKVRCPKCGSLTLVPEAPAELEPTPSGSERKRTKNPAKRPTTVDTSLESDEPKSTKPLGTPLPLWRRKKFLLALGLVVSTLLIAVAILFVFDRISESRRQARAEEAVRGALDQWCSNESLDQVKKTHSGDDFLEFVGRTPFDPRPTGYQITNVTKAKKARYSVSVTLSFPGGPETRLFEVDVYDDSGKCFITTKASEDVSGSATHAQAILQAWLDSWVANEDLETFKKKHPEAAGQMTTDLVWGLCRAEGKRLVKYEFTTVTPSTKGYNFTVTAIIEDRGKPETRILHYELFKDRLLSQGRWTIIGT